MKTPLALLSAALLLGACGSAPAPRAGLAAPLAITKCEALAGLSIPAAAIALPSGGAIVASAERAAEVAPYKDPEGEHLLPTPARCLVLGHVLPVDPGAPPIRFAVNLPLTDWNGRALQSGGGGLGEVINNSFV